ncbi:hypothetical protein [Desulfitobacterium sp. AusDCA]|uniref:hypothetical protein n=1 Tax=Desulfitobacterium sp. AusDCA TaxID=3240383 RepID=UPI003DA6F00C
MSYVTNSDGSIKTFIDANGNIVNLEYRYLEYQPDGYVVKIYNEQPSGITSGNKIAIANNINFEEGHEFSNYIVVQEVDENNNLTSSCMIKQPQSVVFLRQERDKLASALIEAQNAINSLLGV